MLVAYVTMMEKSTQEAFISRLARIAEESSRRSSERTERTFFGDPLPADAMIEAAANRQMTPGHIALRSTVELQAYDPPL